MTFHKSSAKVAKRPKKILLELGLDSDPPLFTNLFYWPGLPSQGSLTTVHVCTPGLPELNPVTRFYRECPAYIHAPK